MRCTFKGMYTTGDIIQLLKSIGRETISRQTISNWCKEFAPYLSVTANPPSNGHRRFTEDDVGVLVLITSMKDMGNTYEDIHASLSIGQRGQLPTPSPNAITPAMQQMMTLQARIIDLEEQLDAAADELKIVREKSIADAALLRRAEEELKRASEREAALQQQIREAYKEIGKLSRDE